MGSEAVARPKVLQLGIIEHAQKEWAAIAKIADIVVPQATDRAAFLDECRSGALDGVQVAFRTFGSVAQTGRLDPELLAALPSSLRFVCHNGAGYDQIDVPACTARGVRVSNTPTAVDEATADLHIFLLLGALRNLTPGMLSIRAGQWRGAGHDPQGKVLGILGMGGIGRAIARKAHAAFGMRIRYYNRRRLPADVEAAHGGAEYVPFDTLLAESDVLSISVPLGPDTRRLIGAAEFAAMKPGIVLVNTARGAVLDEAALVAALASGQVASAGLDVFEHEPAVHPGLLASDRAVLVPHLGTSTVETETKMEAWAISNVHKALTEGSLDCLFPTTTILAHFLWSSQNPATPATSNGQGDDDNNDNNDSMAATQPNQPALTPRFCFSTVVLRDFLRASRAVDDTITQHLNALVTPSRSGFDPSSTARRSSPSSFSSANANAPSPPACRAFRDTVLFPAWQARDDVIQYCTGVAADAVAKDAEAAAAAADAAAAAAAASSLDGASPTSSSSADQPPITERFDPYINRRRYALVEPQADLLAALMRQERGVETIVRARSWEVLQARCGSSVAAAGGDDTGWEAALGQWRQRETR
ncbi:NAD(P)-binding domain protein [Niveomyces insectorum RCEF 264]|uniref:NAD(P)-binding domain protein n=1 Tax=Niveomyces insectorum RCEF 264 TaxID=1081102 RepID=A0A167XYC2_9HYPO|nr:NAD(P)-binding domain protein [Niveomyces insectorum RCEF 264]